MVSRSIAYQQGGVALEGYLAYDEARAGSGKLPGVLVLPEWWGLNDYVKGRADALARLGLVAFAADMFGRGVVTEDSRKAAELAGMFYGKPLMAERAQAGLNQLLATEAVDPGKVAAIGYCFGGSTAQALAYTGAPLAGIVSFHGGLLPVPGDAAERIRAKILICHGAVDTFVKKEDFDGFMKAMNEGGFDYQMVTYPKAVHAFTNPDADRLSKINHLPGIAYNESADRRSWSHMQLFFQEIFGQGLTSAR